MATAKKTTSTAVAVKKPSSGNIVSIQDALKKQAAELNERVAPSSGNQILLTKQKEFKLPNGVTTTEPIEVVVVDFLSMNNFYPEKFDQKNPLPPACTARGTNPLKLVPMKSSPQLQADTCSECPNNEWGSNGDGKACNNERILAVLPKNAEPDDPLWLIKVSKTGIKAWDAYVKAVAGAFGMPPVAVVTTISFDANVDYQSLRFSDPQMNEALEVCYSRQDEARKLLNEEPDFSRRLAMQSAAKAPARKVANSRR